jgi:hypothetical protein
MISWTDITNIFKPLADVIDNLHTSEEERLNAHANLAAAQAATYAKVLDYEARLVESKRDVIVAEAQGQSWLQRNWRPVLMTIFGFIVLNNYVLLPYAGLFNEKIKLLELPPGMWTLLQIGIGGYIVGRSGEKIVHNLQVKKDK